MTEQCEILEWSKLYNYSKIPEVEPTSDTKSQDFNEHRITNKTQYRSVIFCFGKENMPRIKIQI